MEHSIKAQVIALAKSDPYLTVKELAKAAGTTTRYVRTILSEAELSLHELRRLYARRLEHDRGQDDPRENLEIRAELTISKMAGNMLKPQVSSWQDIELFLASTLHRRESLLCYDQLVTPEELRLGMGQGACLRTLLPMVYQRKLEIAGQRAEILPAPGKLGEALGLVRGDHALRLSTFLTVEDEPIALEIRWLGLNGLVLNWSKSERELEVGMGS